MARLSKNNTYAILWLKSQGWTPENIHKELNVTIKQVNSVELPIQTTEQVVDKKKTSKDFMIHETASKTNGVAIMTPQASSMNDDFKKNNKPNNSRNENIIHKIS